MMSKRNVIETTDSYMEYGRSPQREYKRTLDFNVYSILGFGMGITALFSVLSADKIHKSMSFFGLIIIGIIVVSALLPSHINYGKQLIQSVSYSVQFFIRKIIERILKYV